jgi:hypothetical protein
MQNPLVTTKPDYSVFAAKLTAVFQRDDRLVFCFTLLIDGGIPMRMTWSGDSDVIQKLMNRIHPTTRETYAVVCHTDTFSWGLVDCFLTREEAESFVRTRPPEIGTWDAIIAWRDADDDGLEPEE